MPSRSRPLSTSRRQAVKKHTKQTTAHTGTEGRTPVHEPERSGDVANKKGERACAEILLPLDAATARWLYVAVSGAVGTMRGGRAWRGGAALPRSSARANVSTLQTVSLANAYARPQHSSVSRSPSTCCPCLNHLHRCASTSTRSRTCRPRRRRHADVCLCSAWI